MQEYFEPELISIDIREEGNTEVAFQAQKCMDEAEKKQFTEFPPVKSKSAGRKVRLSPDWEEVKTNIMEGENIVVLGGSFNPPTIAHLKVLQTAMSELHAKKGYLVPVSYSYLKRKMIKAGVSHLCIPDEIRLDMLRAMCREDRRIEIYTEDLRHPFAVTYETMSDIKALNPASNLFFLIGTDKLSLMESVCRKTDFLDCFGFVVCARTGERPEAEIEKYENLKLHKPSLVYIKQPEGIEQVSSTAIREYLFGIDRVSDMLLPEICQILKSLREADFPKEIIQFKDEYAFLDNDFQSDIQYEGLVYPSAGSAFQASKIACSEGRKPFTLYTQEKAKQKGGSLKPYDGWEEKKREIMKEIVKEKFVQHPKLRKKLLETRGLRLIAGQKRKERYWGINLSTWEGENHLGKILMELRTEFERK